MPSQHVFIVLQRNSATQTHHRIIPRDMPRVKFATTASIAANHPRFIVLANRGTIARTIYFIFYAHH